MQCEQPAVRKSEEDSGPSLLYEDLHANESILLPPVDLHYSFKESSDNAEVSSQTKEGPGSNEISIRFPIGMKQGLYDRISAKFQEFMRASNKTAAEKIAMEEKASADKKAVEETAAADTKAADEKIAMEEKAAADKKAAAEKKAVEETAAADTKAADEEAAGKGMEGGLLQASTAYPMQP